MATPLNLGTLPPDIKLIITSMEENSMGNVRLISPSWNKAVLDHIKDRRYLLPLERVYLSSDVTDANYQSYGAQDFQMGWSNYEAKKLVHMHALVPEKRTARIGLGKWLTVYKRYPGALEVTCAPQKIDSSIREFMKFLAVQLLFVILYVITNWIVSMVTLELMGPTMQRDFMCLCIILVLTVTAFTTPYLVVNREERQKDKGRRARLTRFFSSFSQINNVVLDTFGDSAILDQMLSTFGKVRIERIEVRMYDLNRRLQNRIVKLTKKHNIRYVSIVTSVCSQGSLGKFLMNLTKMGSVVNIYEGVQDRKNYYKNVLSYFHRPMQFWNAMSEQLKKEGIAVRVTTIRDDNFPMVNCNAPVRTHIYCKPANIEEFHSDLQYPRGYYRTL